MKKWFQPFCIALVLGLWILSLSHFNFFDLRQAVQGLKNASYLWREALPLDTSILPTAFASLKETIQMAFAGTLLGFFLSLPLAVLGTSSLMPTFCVAFARVITALKILFQKLYECS